MPSLGQARYGKDNVRVCKVVRNPETGVHVVTEMIVCALLEGDIATSYTEADNSVVVATDSIKNTIYIKAFEHPVDPPELYAAHLAAHFIERYSHIHAAHVDVSVSRWTRLDVEGKPHPHSFLRDGEETRKVTAHAVRSASGVLVNLRGGIGKLTVLKSTGSAFHGFVRDEYTTLPEVWDRFLSTDVDCTWTWKTLKGIDEVEAAAKAGEFNAAWETAREITLRTFALDESASVQNTMYKMCEEILAKVPSVQSVGYELPNKHYFEIDLSWHKGYKNTGKDAQVYAPQSGPNGLIKCEVSRD